MIIMRRYIIEVISNKMSQLFDYYSRQTSEETCRNA